MTISAEAVQQVTAWKNVALQSYCVQLVKVGLDLLNRGIPYFGSDDVPEAFQPDSHAIPGCAISVLRAGHVIGDYFGTHPDDRIFNGRRMSKRALANGRKVALFQLTNRGMAEEFLNRNDIPYEPTQMELFLTKGAA